MTLSSHNKCSLVVIFTAFLVVTKCLNEKFHLVCWWVSKKERQSLPIYHSFVITCPWGCYTSKCHHLLPAFTPSCFALSSASRLSSRNFFLLSICHFFSLLRFECLRIKRKFLSWKRVLKEWQKKLCKQTNSK